MSFFAWNSLINGQCNFATLQAHLYYFATWLVVDFGHKSSSSVYLSKKNKALQSVPSKLIPFGHAVFIFCKAQCVNCKQTSFEPRPESCQNWERASFAMLKMLRFFWGLKGLISRNGGSEVWTLQYALWRWVHVWQSHKDGVHALTQPVLYDSARISTSSKKTRSLNETFALIDKHDNHAKPSLRLEGSIWSSATCQLSKF